MHQDSNGCNTRNNRIHTQLFKKKKKKNRTAQLQSYLFSSKLKFEWHVYFCSLLLFYGVATQ